MDETKKLKSSEVRSCQRGQFPETIKIFNLSDFCGKFALTEELKNSTGKKRSAKFGPLVGCVAHKEPLSFLIRL